MNKDLIYLCEVIWFDDQEVGLKVTDQEEEQFLWDLDRNLFEGREVFEGKEFKIIVYNESRSIIKIEEIQYRYHSKEEIIRGIEKNKKEF